MAGVFYLPRIFVNLAMETDKNTTARLLLMARKLYRFSMWLSVFAVVFGAILVYHAVRRAHAGLAARQADAGGAGDRLSPRLRRYPEKFERGENKRSHKWFRVFNELPVFAMLAILILVVVKPF
jgi:putative membrane protein